MRDEATGSGLMDISLPWLVETRMRSEEQRSPQQIDAWRRKAGSTLDWLEANIGAIAARDFDIGHVAIGVALSYLDFRFGAENWPEGRPQLAAWHTSFRARPSVHATEFRDDPRPAG